VALRVEYATAKPHGLIARCLEIVLDRHVHADRQVAAIGAFQGRRYVRFLDTQALIAQLGVVSDVIAVGAGSLSERTSHAEPYETHRNPQDASRQHLLLLLNRTVPGNSRFL